MINDKLNTTSSPDLLMNEIDRLRTALMDIATCSIPDVPTGCTVGMEQYGSWVMKKARETLWGDEFKT